MTHLQKLLKAETEAKRRLEKAEEAHAEAKDKLNAALVAGQDTSAARRLEHETRRLVRFAGEELESVQGELFALRQAQTDEVAAAMTAEAHRALSARLASFDLHSHL